MYTIKRAAELTGVPEATLRAWERRYGVINPARTSAGYRLYDETCLQRVRSMRSLLAAGWAPRQAARRVMQPALPPMAPTDLSASIPEFVSAARNLDSAMLDSVIDNAFARAGFELVVDEWMMPALTELGRGWAEGDVSIAAEHLAALAVRRRLTAAFEAAATGAGGPGVVIGLPERSRHELGALAFATAARRQGLDVLYLGSDLPAAEWVDAVRRHRALAIVVAVPLDRDIESARAVVSMVHAAHPRAQICVGGQHQDAIGEPAVPLGHPIGQAARTLVDRLAINRLPAQG